MPCRNGDGKARHAETGKGLKSANGCNRRRADMILTNLYFNHQRVTYDIGKLGVTPVTGTRLPPSPSTLHHGSRHQDLLTRICTAKWPRRHSLVHSKTAAYHSNRLDYVARQCATREVPLGARYALPYGDAKPILFLTGCRSRSASGLSLSGCRLPSTVV